MTHPSLRHPGRWIWLLVLVPVLWGLTRLRFDVEVLGLLPQDLEVVQGLELYQRHFANARQLIITVRAPEAELAETAAREIAATLRQSTNLVTSVTWQSPWLEEPGQLSEFLAYLWFNHDPAVFGAWTNQLSGEHLLATFTAVREELATSLSPAELARLSYDPLGLTRFPESAPGLMPGGGEGQEVFSSSDGRFRVLFVQAGRELRTYRECQQWLASIQSLTWRAVARAPGPPVALGYTGRPAFVAEAAAGMERDMEFSVGGTAAIIALLFWLAHRRLKPMIWLLTLLAIILGSTLALGGLIFGTINIVSMGFAAILLGLAVDYAVVHYQEALAQPQLSIAQVRHAIAPSIFWAAATTVAAFLMLNFGGLPGLGQLGTLVGLGVALAAGIMIFEFLPVLFPGREDSPGQVGATETASSAGQPYRPVRLGRTAAASGVTLAATLIVLLGLGLPKIDPTANALRPRESPVYAALKDVRELLGQKEEPLWLIVGGGEEGEVAQRLAAVQAALNQARSSGLVTHFAVPAMLWPSPENQAANRSTARDLASQMEVVRTTAAAAGFAEVSLSLAQGALQTWERAGHASGLFWPTNSMSQWILEKMVARTGTNAYALGVLNLGTSEGGTPAQLASLKAMLPAEQVWLSGWELLGQAIYSRVQANLWKVLLPMIGLVLLSLWLAFQSAREVTLSLASLLLSGIILLAVMRLAGWSWNLLNLMAVPLILGTGVDYGIFMQSGLRRYRGDLAQTHRAVGRALLLCGGTAIAGFGSLSWSSNEGMASLGRVCAVGIASNMLLAVYLLPGWWRAVVKPDPGRGPGNQDPLSPL